METPTPLERAPRLLADFVGRESVWLKREDVHELGAFKWRSTVSVVDEFVRDGNEIVVTSSTRPLISWACRTLGTSQLCSSLPVRGRRSSGFSPTCAPDIRFAGRDLDEAKEVGRAYAVAEVASRSSLRLLIVGGPPQAPREGRLHSQAAK